MIIGENHRVGIMLSAVTRVRRTADYSEVMVYTSDEDFETYSAFDFDNALHNTAQASFPADGAVQLLPLYDENMKPCGAWRRAILGFYVDGTGELRAVTLDGNMGDLTILFADGHVEQFEERWDSLEDYERELVAKGTPQRLAGGDR